MNRPISANSIFSETQSTVLFRKTHDKFNRLESTLFSKNPVLKDFEELAREGHWSELIEKIEVYTNEHTNEEVSYINTILCVFTFFGKIVLEKEKSNIVDLIKLFNKKNQINFLKEQRESFLMFFSIIEDPLNSIVPQLPDYSESYELERKGYQNINKDASIINILSINKISTSSSHALFLSEEGLVLGIGSNERGQLCTHCERKDYFSFKICLDCILEEKIIDLSVSNGISGCLTKRGMVKIWGFSQYDKKIDGANKLLLSKEGFFIIYKIYR